MSEKEFRLMPYKVKAIQNTPGEYIPKGVRNIGAYTLWGKGDGIERVHAVIDTGVDYNHVDLKDNVIGGVDFTGKGDYMDGNGHGTHVSGTIAASNNETGIVGVDPEAKIFGLKALSDNGTGSMIWTMQAMRRAIDEGVHVINMSLGGPHLPQLEELVQEAVEKGIVVVAASGNAGDGLIFTPEISFPGYYEESLQVGAVDHDGDLAYFSNTNKNVDVLAPGVQILSTYPGNQYAVLDGTSMATPHVSGAVSLIQRNNLIDNITDCKNDNRILNLKQGVK